MILETIAVACSMFSALPMPQIRWNEGNMRYALWAFPLVGGVIGGLCWLLKYSGKADPRDIDIERLMALEDDDDK